MKELVLSDESVNRHGFIVLNSAINLEDFRRNPVMFYNHKTELGVIGRWDNLRFESGKLIGAPVFDESCELGWEIKKRFEEGFITSASLGFFFMEKDVDRTSRPFKVTKLDLYEVSIVDIPSNRNAVALFTGNRQKVADTEHFLKSILNITDMDFLQQLGEILGIENPTEKSILDAVRALAESNESQVNSILKLSIEKGIVKAEHQEYLLQMGEASPAAFFKYIKQQEKEHEEETNKKVSLYMKENNQKFKQMTVFELSAFKELGRKDYNLFFKIADALPERKTLSEQIQGICSGTKAKNEDRSQWALEDYRKNAPEELRRNPELYKELLEEYKNNKRK